MRLTAVAAFLLAVPSLAQLVQTGPRDPDYCSKERVRPNLELRTDVRIVGTIQDQTTAPFENSRVELRRYISEKNQPNVQNVMTDAKGRFDLGVVKPGKYRLLASPTRVFEQPSSLHCPKGRECELRITLIANPTDQPYFDCPIR